MKLIPEWLSYIFTTGSSLRHLGLDMYSPDSLSDKMPCIAGSDIGTPTVPFDCLCVFSDAGRITAAVFACNFNVYPFQVLVFIGSPRCGWKEGSSGTT